MLFGIAHSSAGAPGDVPPELTHLFTPGCTAEAPFASGGPEQLQHLPLSRSSFRLAIVPDAYGDAFIATIDTGTHRATQEQQPFVQFSIGGLTGTCTARMPLDACPEAQQVRDSLKALQVPIGLGMDEGVVMTLHGTTYALEFTSDALGAYNRLEYDGAFNPIREALDASREALWPCWQSVADEHAALPGQAQRERPRQ